jgi:trans-aconitate methyltransferase
MMTECVGPMPAFGDWAALYQQFRPAYPAEAFDRLRTAMGTGRMEMCVELGAGSGQATADLLDLFACVEAVEPDAAMAALIPASPRLTVQVAPAETCVLLTGADAIVAATAFHWMDQALVARRAAAALRPGGVFYVFAYGPPQYKGATMAALARLNRHHREARAHMHDRIASWRPYQDALREAGCFADVQGFEIYVEHQWTPDEAAGFLATTSFGQAQARASGDAAKSQASLARDLADAMGRRPLVVRFPIEAAYGVAPTSSK